MSLAIFPSIFQFGYSDPFNVIFDGPNKLIIEVRKPGDPLTTELDVQDDIYSAWKRWVSQADNSKYDQALRTIGGDPITNTVSIGGTYFLLNGWKIKPAEYNHTLTITGNIFVDGGGVPYTTTSGDYNVGINTVTSNIINTVTVETGGTGGEVTLPNSEVQKIAEAVEAQLDPILSRILGLNHNNFRLFDQQYDPKGNMTFGRIRLYDSASDTNSDTDPIGEYEIFASYDSNGKMTEYKSIAV